MNIAVLYNKPSLRFMADPTHKEAEEDTEHSAKEVAEALRKKCAEARIVPVTEHTISSVIKSIRTDLVFNLIEWTGMDIPYEMAAFDALNGAGLHYTGATKENYRDTSDKIITKRLCRTHGLPTAPWQEFRTGNEAITITSYPVLVKVSGEHSSVGIATDAIARNGRELRVVVNKRLRTFQQPVLAETFLTCREFQVTLLQKKDGLDVLPPAEILYTPGTDVPLLTYESRWNERHADYKNSDVVLAELDTSLADTLDILCSKAFTALGFRDYARFDVRCDEKDHPYFLELNSNPGLSHDPDYGMTVSYQAAGMTFADFVWEIVRSTLKRYGT